MPEFLLNPELWLAFLTLAALEIVLGIDNIIFISIVTGRLPKEQQARGRFLGLSLATAAYQRNPATQDVRRRSGAAR